MLSSYEEGTCGMVLNVVFWMYACLIYDAPYCSSCVRGAKLAEEGGGLMESVDGMTGCVRTIGSWE